VVDCHPMKDIDTLQLDLRKGGPIRVRLQLGEKKSYLQDLRGDMVGRPGRGRGRGREGGGQV
jgi:hypothetical protein